MQRILWVATILPVATLGCSGPPNPVGVGDSQLSSPNRPVTWEYEALAREIRRFRCPPDLSKELVLCEVPALRLSKPEAKEASPSSEHVEMLISALANIDSPEFGLSPKMRGCVVIVGGTKMSDPFPYIDDRLESSSAVQELARIGPAALPALLRHLDDATPTRLTVQSAFEHGSMWFDRELWANPASEFEQRVLRGRSQVERPPPGEGPRSYTVKVGDVCFVAIGQITGRGYHAVRCERGACVVLNSPTHDPTLCAQVRDIWQSDDPQQKLFESLLQDYATRGKYEGDGLDSWYIGSRLQVEAAMRLLYYFPRESLQLIVERIDRLNVAEGEPWIERQLANGVRAEDFISAVSWSKHPDVIAAIKRAADRKQRSAMADPGKERSHD